jgi:hypothetical protein
VKLKPNETVVFAWVTYKSRKHRDRVVAKVMKDAPCRQWPRRQEAAEPDLDAVAAVGLLVARRLNWTLRLVPAGSF